MPLPPSLPPSLPLPQTKAGFAEGLKSIMDTLPSMLKTMKDPTISTRALSELLAEDVDGMNVSLLFLVCVCLSSQPALSSPFVCVCVCVCVCFSRQ